MLHVLASVGLPRLVSENTHDGANLSDKLNAALTNLEVMEDFDSPKRADALAESDLLLQQEMVHDPPPPPHPSPPAIPPTPPSLHSTAPSARFAPQERADVANLQAALEQCEASPPTVDAACFEKAEKAALEASRGGLEVMAASLKNCVKEKDSNVYASGSTTDVGPKAKPAPVVQVWTSDIRLALPGDVKVPGWPSAKGMTPHKAFSPDVVPVKDGGHKMMSINFDNVLGQSIATAEDGTPTPYSQVFLAGTGSGGDSYATNTNSGVGGAVLTYDKKVVKPLSDDFPTLEVNAEITEHAYMGEKGLAVYTKGPQEGLVSGIFIEEEHNGKAAHVWSCHMFDCGGLAAKYPGAVKAFRLPITYVIKAAPSTTALEREEDEESLEDAERNLIGGLKKKVGEAAKNVYAGVKTSVTSAKTAATKGAKVVSSVVPGLNKKEAEPTPADQKGIAFIDCW